MDKIRVMVSVRNGGFFNEEETYQWDCVLFYKFLNFQLTFILEMEEESWILSTSMPRKIVTPKVDRNTKILEDLGAVIYDTTNALENFGNDLKELKEKHEKESKI